MREDYQMNYNFYLDSYSCFFEKEDCFFVYNTLNGKWADCSVTEERRRLFAPFLEGINYSISLSEDMIRECQLEPFIKAVRDGFSGDLILAGAETVTPFLFPSLPDFKYEMKKLDKKERALGHEVYQNLKELHLFLHPRIESGKGPFLPEQIFYMKDRFPIAEDWQQQYSPFLQDLTLVWKGKLHIWCNQIGADMWPSLNEVFSSLPIQKVIHTGVDSSLPPLNKFINKEDYSFEVFVTDDSEATVMDTWTVFHSGMDNEITFQWLITSEKEWKKASEWIEKNQTVAVDLKPYFNGRNRKFFEKYIFLKEEDLFFEIIRKKDIFARKALNTNYFGKLYLFSDGKVYAHPADNSLGAITDTPLPEMIYRELTEGKSWLLIRNQEPCASCRYQWICPSPSDYERALMVPNLCHLKKKGDAE